MVRAKPPSGGPVRGSTCSKEGWPEPTSALLWGYPTSQPGAELSCRAWGPEQVGLTQVGLVQWEGEGRGRWGGGRRLGAHCVNAGSGTQQLHGPRGAQRTIATGRLAVAAPHAAQTPTGRLAAAAVRVVHGAVIQGH